MNALAKGAIALLVVVLLLPLIAIPFSKERSWFMLDGQSVEIHNNTWDGGTIRVVYVSPDSTGDLEYANGTISTIQDGIGVTGTYLLERDKFRKLSGTITLGGTKPIGETAYTFEVEWSMVAGAAYVTKVTLQSSANELGPVELKRHIFGSLF